MISDSGTKRKMRKHIAINEFHKRNPDGSVITIPPNICACTSWEVGKPKCKCGKTPVYLDYSDTTGIVSPTNLPVGDM